MDNLIRGVDAFQKNVFPEHQSLFGELANGQHPEVLFVTCSDSRIDPCMVTQTKPGDLFVLRNAGNIVPPYGASNGGEAAAVEFAIAGLGVKHVVVCGHSQCGAIGGLLNPEKLQTLPTVANWLNHAANTKRVVETRFGNLSSDEQVVAAVEQNVLVQLDNLKTHPAVAAQLADNAIQLHAWVYEFESGKITAYDENAARFTGLNG